MKFNLISKIRALLTQTEQAMATLESREIELLEALESISVDSYHIDVIGVGKDEELSNEEYLKWQLYQELYYISKKKNRLRSRIRGLKIRIRFFIRNLRTCIRQIHHFIFNSLDETARLEFML
jgi:hypothetical protein